MYSIVMMAALTTAPDSPQFNGYFRDMFRRDNAGCTGCYGCNGCTGAMRYSCSGGCVGTAYTASCSGCGGGSVFGWGMSDRVRRWFDRDTSSYGCCGGRSYACSGYACSGSAFSCFGAPISYTPMLSGGLGCQGGMPFAPPPMLNPYPAPGVPNIPYAVPDPAPGSTGSRLSAPAPTTLTSGGTTARATVIVKLPADARLFADSRALSLTGSERKFVSPELPVNQEFVYRFRAEYERDGETVSVMKKVPVRAGGTVTIEFTDLTAAKPTPTVIEEKKNDKITTPVAKPVSQGAVKTEPPIKPVVTPAPAPVAETPAAPSERATITVKLPPGATLFVDDRKSPSADPVRSFSTPPLPAGREFAYLLKAEIIRNGQPETLTQKVPFRAGERVIVDFTSLGK